MRAVVAGAGVAGLASALALARARHDVALIDRDRIDLVGPPASAFDWIRQGIPHFQQPHAFLPRGRLVLLRLFPDIVSALLEAGADDYDVSRKIPGERHEEDSELIFLSARRPLIEWALRDAVIRQKGITLVPGAKVTGLRLQKGTPARVTGVTTDGGDCFQADVVVDALGRTSPCAKWISASSAPTVPEVSSDCGLIYYSRYFRLRPGMRFPDGPWILTPRGDLGYAMFSTFIGDNGTFAAFIGIPSFDRELRVLQHEVAFMTTCRAIRLLAPLVDSSFAEPITPVMPMGGLQNTLRQYVCDGTPYVTGLLPVGDAVCHTDPAFALGLSFSLLHAAEVVAALSEPRTVEAVTRSYFPRVMPEIRERFALSCSIDEARLRLWKGEALDFTRADGCYPLFMLVAAPAVALKNAEVFRKTIRRMAFLDRLEVFDNDLHLQEKVEKLFAQMLASGPLPKHGPPREELLQKLNGAAESPVAT